MENFSTDTFAEMKDILREIIKDDEQDLNIEILMDLCNNQRYVEFVELLIMKNVDINIKDEKQRNILMHILTIAYENMLKSNSNMNDSSYDISLEIKRIGLFYEIREAIELLINRGIEINVRDRQGDTSLDYAFKLGDIGLIKLLIKKGAKISKKFQENINANFLAQVLEDKLFLEILLEQGIDINMQDSIGITILMIASEKGDKDLVKYLIKKGADVNIQNNYGDTALIFASEKGHFDVVDILLKENSNVNYRDCNNLTALMYACIRRRIGVVKLLLEKDVDLNIQDKRGYTALMLAANEEDSEIVRLLLNKGADINITNNSGCTLLNDLCRKKNIDILKLIVKNTDCNDDINLVARLIISYINYEKFKDIDNLKKVISIIPSGKKFKIYNQFFKETEGKFEALFDTKTLRYKTLMKADPIFFNILNTANQILNKENNIGNSIEKLYLVMVGFCGMIRKYYGSENIFAKEFIKAIKNSADNMMKCDKSEHQQILNIEKTLEKIKKEELLFLLTKTKAGNIHNIPEIVFKIQKGPLKDRYALLLVNFGYGYNLNNLGASQVTMYIFSMDTKDEIKEVAKTIFEISNDFGNVESNASKIDDFYKKIHKLFFRKSKRITKSVYNISKVSNNDESFGQDEKVACLSAKDNKNLGIVLRFGNNIPKNICNCYIKQQQKAIELIFSILKTCYDKRNEPNFDIVSFMRDNSLDESKVLKYTHLNGLLIQKVEEKKKKGMDTKRFKKEFIKEILKVAVKGYIGENKDIRKITEKEARSIKRELFPKNSVEAGLIK